MTTSMSAWARVVQNESLLEIAREIESSGVLKRGPRYLVPPDQSLRAGGRLADIGLGWNQSSIRNLGVGIIGGADGPTAIFLSSRLAPELLGAIAIAGGVALILFWP